MLNVSRKKFSLVLSALPLTMLAVGGGTDLFSQTGAPVTPTYAQTRALAEDPQSSKAAEDTREETHPQKNSPDFFKQLESGVRTDAELDEEWNSWVGTNPAQAWQNIKLKKNQRLSMVVTEMRVDGPNASRMMFIHSISDEGHADDMVTLYDREIDGMEESNIQTSFPVAHALKINGAAPEMNKLNAYTFYLKPNSWKRTYDLRKPNGQARFAELKSGDTNMIEEIMKGGSVSDSDDGTTYTREVITNGQPEMASLQMRQTEIGTLSVTVEFKNADGEISRRVALIYQDQ